MAGTTPAAGSDYGSRYGARYDEFYLRPACTITIIGASGSGKSTLMRRIVNEWSHIFPNGRLRRVFFFYRVFQPDLYKCDDDSCHVVCEQGLPTSSDIFDKCATSDDDNDGGESDTLVVFDDVLQASTKSDVIYDMLTSFAATPLMKVLQKNSSYFFITNSPHNTGVAVSLQRQLRAGLRSVFTRACTKAWQSASSYLLIDATAHNRHPSYILRLGLFRDETPRILEIIDMDDGRSRLREMFVISREQMEALQKRMEPPTPPNATAVETPATSALPATAVVKPLTRRAPVDSVDDDDDDDRSSGVYNHTPSSSVRVSDRWTNEPATSAANTTPRTDPLFDAVFAVVPQRYHAKVRSLLDHLVAFNAHSAHPQFIYDDRTGHFCLDGRWVMNGVFADVVREIYHPFPRGASAKGDLSSITRAFLYVLSKSNISSHAFVNGAARLYIQNVRRRCHNTA